MVEAGDPARDALNLLKRRGYTRLVLPRALLRGTLGVEALALPSCPPRGSSGRPALSAASRCRLEDCVTELMNG